MKLPLIIIVCVFCFHCGISNLEEPGEPSIEDILSSGWAMFNADEYEAAITEFDKVLAKEPEHAEANVGKGWSHLLKSSYDLETAGACFQKGILDDTRKLDANCGLVVVKFNQKAYSEIISLVDLVLSEQPQYVFQPKPNIDWHDLLLIKAQALFFTKQYTQAWVTVQTLSFAYTLDPDAAETWVVNGIKYFSFEAALSKIIEILSEFYCN